MEPHVYFIENHKIYIRQVAFHESLHGCDLDSRHFVCTFVLSLHYTYVADSFKLERFIRLVDQGNSRASEERPLAPIKCRRNQVSGEYSFPEPAWSLNHNALVALFHGLPHIVHSLRLSVTQDAESAFVFWFKQAELFHHCSPVTRQQRQVIAKSSLSGAAPGLALLWASL
jgi:hypothetical protein